MTEHALKPKNPHFESYGGTHQGRVRPINEDRFLARPEYGVFVVADGMGGHSHGDIASSAIVQSIEDALAPASHRDQVMAISQSLVSANDKIGDMSTANDNIVMGSTVAALLVSPKLFTVLWTGDSRVYLVREGRIRQLTTDHTEAEMLLRQGAISRDQARDWPRKNVIVHAIGVGEEPHIELTEGAVRLGDVFVLCSDGLTNHLSDSEIQATAEAAPPHAACLELIRTALARGGSDNVSVIVVRCGD